MGIELSARSTRREHPSEQRGSPTNSREGQRVKIIGQLLREFWLPLLLGVAWTAFNFIDRPPATWTLRDFLNIFGPTFFFMSWIIAQWYRVRKQQKVEEGLSDIQAGVRAIQSPLLPCGLFFTLKIIASDEVVERVFGKQEGFRSYGPDCPMPPPPFGLPFGQRDGQLLRRDDYLIFKDGIVVAAGAYRLDHPGFNSIRCDVKHTVSHLEEDMLSRIQTTRSEPLFSQPSVRVELFSKGRNSNVKPFLILSSSMTTGHPSKAIACDNSIFVDFIVPSLSVIPSDATNLSSSVLNGASILVY